MGTLYRIFHKTFAKCSYRIFRETFTQYLYRIFHETFAKCSYRIFRETFTQYLYRISRENFAKFQNVIIGVILRKNAIMLYIRLSIITPLRDFNVCTWL
jgi:hypothetical protein